MRYFDFETVASQAGISERELGRLRKAVARQFPDDPMMQELHLLRLCSAIRDGEIGVAAALAAVAA